MTLLNVQWVVFLLKMKALQECKDNQVTRREWKQEFAHVMHSVMEKNKLKKSQAIICDNESQVDERHGHDKTCDEVKRCVLQTVMQLYIRFI